jgi:transcriptional regulator with XRE-family HTH domain
MKSDTLIKFGEVVRKKRQEKGLSQEDFAELVGVHRTYVGMIERAEKNITLLNIEKIAQAFDISISELLENL